MEKQKEQNDLRSHLGRDFQDEWHQLADGILDRMSQTMGYQPDGHFSTLDEREEMAEKLSHEIGSFLLEKTVAADHGLQKWMHAEKASCPHCQRQVSRLKDKEGKPRLETIFMETKVGKVPVELPLFHCWKCKRNFSPLQDIIKTKTSRL